MTKIRVEESKIRRCSHPHQASEAVCERELGRGCAGSICRLSSHSLAHGDHHSIQPINVLRNLLRLRQSYDLRSSTATFFFHLDKGSPKSCQGQHCRRSVPTLLIDMTDSAALDVKLIVLSQLPMAELFTFKLMVCSFEEVSLLVERVQTPETVESGPFDAKLNRAIVPHSHPANHVFGKKK